jgi:hypothetical protein
LPAPFVAAAASNGEPSVEIVVPTNPRDWTRIAAGIGGGVLLGAIGWFVTWLASPDEVQSVASTEAPAVTAPAEPAAPQQTPAAAAATSAPATQPSAPAASPAEAQPQPTPNDAVVAPSPAANIATTEAPAPDAPPAESPAAPAPATPSPEAQSPTATVPELKLDPVTPQPAAPTSDVPSADSAGDHTPTDNLHAESAAVANPPALVESSPGEPAPLAVAEIQRRLSVGISRVDFSGVPLGHLAAFVSDVSGARVVLDEPSLAKSGKSRKTPVTVKLNGGTALAILEAAAEQAGLDYKIEPGRITLSARGP